MPEASVNGALQSLYYHYPRDNLDLFYGKVSLGHLSQISGERLQDHWSSDTGLLRDTRTSLRNGLNQEINYPCAFG